MRDLIIRNDDINANSNFNVIEAMYNIIKGYLPDVRIISCVSLLSKKNSKGAVYSNLPFKQKTLAYFYDVDRFAAGLDGRLLYEIASHGLIHADHSKLDSDAQKMSILTSCNYLRTNMFCPPFGKYNDATVAICERYGIKLIKGDWRSFEHNKFDLNHKYWYFHSWRYSISDFRKKIVEGIHAESDKLGQLQGSAKSGIGAA